MGGGGKKKKRGLEFFVYWEGVGEKSTCTATDFHSGRGRGKASHSCSFTFAKSP